MDTLWYGGMVVTGVLMLVGVAFENRTLMALSLVLSVAELVALFVWAVGVAIT